jgi:hypothetical protein
MGAYLVTWKLKKEREDHDEVLAALVARLEAYPYITVEEFESAYFISTPLAAGQVNADLSQGLGNEDLIVVAQVLQGSYCGRMPQPVWDWVEERL